MDERPSPPVEPGQVVAGKYRIERLIGRGGMAAVFAAHHEILQQTVALKVLLPHVAATPGAPARFLNEARAAARIRGEHVTTVMDVGTLDDGSAYMVLEYLEGQDLEAYAATHGPLPPAEAVGYVLESLEAIAQAHALGIVHRDVKPSNLFLARRPDGSTVVKVLDFGISKAPPDARADASSTASQALLGSPGYMAPEQARSAKSVDARADIWAVGVLLYRVLTGEAPFSGENLTEMLVAILEHTPPPMHARRPEIPEELDAIVSRCMAKTRDERYADVAQLAMALEPFAGEEARRSVQRVRRTLGAARGSSGSDARTEASTDASAPAPAEAPPGATRTADAPAAVGPRTASSWSESHAREGAKPSPRNVPVWGVAAGLVLLGGVAGLVALRSGASRAPSAEGSAAAAPSASAPSSAPSKTRAAPPALPMTEAPATAPASASPAASSPQPATDQAHSSRPLAVEPAAARSREHRATAAAASARPAPSTRPAPSSSPAAAPSASPDDDVLNRRN